MREHTAGSTGRAVAQKSMCGSGVAHVHLEAMGMTFRTKPPVIPGDTGIFPSTAHSICQGTSLLSGINQT